MGKEIKSIFIVFRNSAIYSLGFVTDVDSLKGYLKEENTVVYELPISLLKKVKRVNSEIEYE